MLKFLLMRLPILKIKVKYYSNPKKVGGWLGWLETKKGRVVGFIHQNGSGQLGFFGG